MGGCFCSVSDQGGSRHHKFSSRYTKAGGDAKECCGLPLALITIGRAMAGTKTPEEWEKKIQILKNYRAKFQDTEDLFQVLATSYDSLPDEAIKSCFLYCS